MPMAFFVLFNKKYRIQNMFKQEKIGRLLTF